MTEKSRFCLVNSFYMMSCCCSFPLQFFDLDNYYYKAKRTLEQKCCSRKWGGDKQTSGFFPRSLATVWCQWDSPWSLNVIFLSAYFQDDILELHLHWGGKIEGSQNYTVRPCLQTPNKNTQQLHLLYLAIRCFLCWGMQNVPWTAA